MPRTYPDSKKEQWLAQLSRGTSPKQIASKSGCDQRTVVRAAQEIRSRRAAQEALTQLYKDALREHMNKLNTTLDTIIDDMRLPDQFMTEIAWLQIATSHTISSPVGETGGERVLGNWDDTLSDNALLAEHLRNSKPWRAFADWDRNLKKHRNACGQLQEKALSVIIETTGLIAHGKVEKTITPLLHAENAGDLLCRTVIKHLSGAENAPDLEKELNVDPERGAVRHYTTVLAEGFKDTNTLSECRNNIIKSFEILKKSSEAQQVLNIFRQLQVTLPKVRTELRTVRLMGVIPGQCRVCHQFGL
jgi:hypothetical protein